MRKEVIGRATLYLGDCFEVLPTLEPVDAVITDPPFEAEAHTLQRRALGRGKEDGRRDIKNAALPFAAITEAQRIALGHHIATKSKGWALVFCQAEAIGAWRDALEDGGAKWRRAMVWVKPDGMPQFSGDRPGMGHESIATAWCGEGGSTWNGGGRHGVFVVPKHDAGQGHGGRPNDHPTTKPIRLMRDLVGLFTQPGQVVLDPCMGSGTTGAACVELDRHFVGIEVEPKYFDIACERIENAQRQSRMFG
jgi:site-specific DNA-methyltransferase (adenine-specific)